MIHHRWLSAADPVVVVAVLAGSFGLSRAAEPAASASLPRVDFAREVLPILAANCFACHGPDAAERVADLRLDTQAGATAHAIVPGDAEQSELISRVTSTEDELRMPPPETDRQLTAAEVEVLRRWINEGADWAEHWAFVPPTKPDEPACDMDTWPRSAIDRFVLADLEAAGLKPSVAASREEWLRRVSFDLIGLPPTPEDLQAFAADTSVDAFEKQVDRLLASPHYGERMASDWLDIARFADTNGYQNDFNRSMWPWRDWVINAFNANMPADQFLIEQMAGDLLPEPSQDQLIATGFHRNHRMVTEGGSIDEEWRVENVVDRVETTATAFLGLTMGCARCHDHKYDPVSRRDFYSFYAFFNNVDEQGVYTERRGNVPPLIEVPTPEEQQRLAEVDAQLAEAKQRLAEAKIDLAASLGSDSPVSDAPPAFLRGVLNRSLVVESEGGPAEAVEGVAAPADAEWVASPVGEGINLLGSEASQVTLGQAVQPNADASLSWTLWARVDGDGALLSKMDDGAAYRGFDTILLGDLRLKVHLISAWPGDAVAVTTKVAVPRQEWFHLAVSYDGSRKAAGVKVWLDGAPLETNLEQDSFTGELQTAEPLRIGRRSSGLFLEGSVADVTFFHASLTDDSVEQLRRADLRRQVPVLEVAADSLPQATQAYLRREASGDLRLDVERLQKQRDQLAGSVQTAMIMRDRSEVRPTYMLRRGQYDQPEEGEPLKPDVPQSLGTLGEGPLKTRLDLARWFVEPTNPLTARVLANRLWRQFFGRGIVTSLDNLGVQGDPPSHPELLDWLAVRLRESGWDVKALQREIALSATYRQTGASADDLRERDPENRLLARGPRRRLSEEMIRDNALAVSGLLSERLGGPSVKPYQPEGLWDDLAGGANGGPYVLSEGDNLYRRSLYTFRKRTVSHPTLSTFDAPSWEICQAKRGTTNTPLQSLALLNDTTYAEAAAHLAVRMEDEAGSDRPSQLRLGFLLATSRLPTETEAAALTRGYATYLAHYRDHTADVTALLSHGGSPIAEDRRTPELAALTAVATVILNLDETVSR